MAVYERRVRVAAPLEEVWEFHSTARGLEVLTPDWMNLEVEEKRGPDGERDPEELREGSTIVSSVRPFGIGPRQRWTSDIVAHRREDDHALFRDAMVDGPFAAWEHTHRFDADGDATMITDRVEYELPGGPVGRALSPAALIGFEPMFRHRHRRTKALLE